MLFINNSLKLLGIQYKRHWCITSLCQMVWTDDQSRLHNTKDNWTPSIDNSLKLLGIQYKRHRIPPIDNSLKLLRIQYKRHITPSIDDSLKLLGIQYKRHWCITSLFQMVWTDDQSRLHRFGWKIVAFSACHDQRNSKAPETFGRRLGCCASCHHPVPEGSDSQKNGQRSDIHRFKHE